MQSTLRVHGGGGGIAQQQQRRPSLRARAGFGGFGKATKSKQQPPQQQQPSTASGHQLLTGEKACPCGSGVEYKVRLAEPRSMTADGLCEFIERAAPCASALCAPPSPYTHTPHARTRSHRPPDAAATATTGVLRASPPLQAAAGGGYTGDGAEGALQRDGPEECIFPEGDQVGAAPEMQGVAAFECCSCVVARG